MVFRKIWNLFGKAFFFTRDTLQNIVDSVDPFGFVNFFWNGFWGGSVCLKLILKKARLRLYKFMTDIWSAFSLIWNPPSSKNLRTPGLFRCGSSLRLGGHFWNPNGVSSQPSWRRHIAALSSKGNLRIFGTGAWLSLKTLFTPTKRAWRSRSGRCPSCPSL
jgi:hypothetical protein